MGYTPPQTAPTKLVGPDGVPLSGSVALNAGNAQSILRQGNGFLFGASNNQRARTVPCFFPGVVAARTGLIVPVPSAILSSLDCMFRVAPAATDGANFAALRVKGTNPGSPSVALPFQTNGTAEYHLGMADLSPNIGAAGSSTQGGVRGRKAYAFQFHPTTNVTIGGLAVNVADPTGSLGVLWPLRLGICDATLTGTSGHTIDTIPWIKDAAGAPAFVDVQSGDTQQSNNVGGVLPWTPAAFQNPVSLVSGTNYRVVAVGAPNSIDTQTANGMCPINGSSGYASSGNILATSALLFGTPSPGGGNPHTDTFIEIHALDNPFAVRFLGSVLGTALSGPVSVAVEITGAPATPGTDLMVSCQV